MQRGEILLGPAELCGRAGFLGGVPFDTLRRGGDWYASESRDAGVEGVGTRRRTSSHASRARRDGGGPRRRTRRGREAASARLGFEARPGCGRGARAHGASRERRVADGGSRRREPKAHRTPSPRSERAAEEATRRPKPPRASKQRGFAGADETTPHTATTPKTKQHTQVLDIHGRQKQQKRTSTFFEFCRATSGVLLCTDVAARGLDIPEVNWIVQFDPPDDPREYVHRVGRTARGETGTGRALLFLAPAELGFLRWLRDARVALHEYEFDMSKVTNIQSALTKLVEKNYYLHRARGTPTGRTCWPTRRTRTRTFLTSIR